MILAITMAYPDDSPNMAIVDTTKLSDKTLAKRLEDEANKIDSESSYSSAEAQSLHDIDLPTPITIDAMILVFIE